MPRSMIGRWVTRYRSTSRLERREFLRRTLAASGGLLLSSQLSHTVLAGADSQRRIVIIGAGFAGLACAHELAAVGHDVRLLEARNRIGGRVLSANANNQRPFIKGMNVEFGGELIGSNHPAWVQFAARFGLELQDMGDDDGDLPVWIEGRRFSAEEALALWDDLDAALHGLNTLAAPVDEDRPWLTDGAERLDAQSVQGWIDSLDVEPLVKRGLGVSLTADNGRDADQQSLLGLLTAVQGGGLERFWTESEVYRCRGGNDQLAEALAASIGQTRIALRTQVLSVTRQGELMVVETAAGQRYECDDVVLTAPPRTWPKIKFTPQLPAAMDPQTGFNAKYFAIVSSRFWSDLKLSQYALADEGLQMTWDATDGQGDIVGDSAACLVGFAGGSVCEAASESDPRDRERLFAQVLERCYPGFHKHFVRGFYMNWPKEPWSGAGYSFPAPQQVTTVGPLLAQSHMDGGLHVAGEHACYKFVGYMEGALQSGLRVAREISAMG